MDFKPAPIVPAPSVAYSDKQFLHTQTAAVTVPLMQSAVTAVIVFIIALVLAIKFRAQDLFSVPVLLSVLSFGTAWLWLQRRWLNLTNLERLTGLDLNSDKVVGTVKPVVTVVRIVQENKGHYQSRDINLSATPVQLRDLAQGFADGRSFTEREWCGAGKSFSSEPFRILRAEMQRGLLIELINEKNARKGFRLTAEGEKWRDACLADDK